MIGTSGIVFLPHAQTYSHLASWRCFQKRDVGEGCFVSGRLEFFPRKSGVIDVSAQLRPFFGEHGKQHGCHGAVSSFKWASVFPAFYQIVSFCSPFLDTNFFFTWMLTASDKPRGSMFPAYGKIGLLMTHLGQSWNCVRAVQRLIMTRTRVCYC